MNHKSCQTKRCKCLNLKLADDVMEKTFPYVGALYMQCEAGHPWCHHRNPRSTETHMPEFHSTMFVTVLLHFASEVCLVDGWRVVAAGAKVDHISGAQPTHPPKTTPKYRSVPLRVGRAGIDQLCEWRLSALLCRNFCRATAEVPIFSPKRPDQMRT